MMGCEDMWVSIIWLIRSLFYDQVLNKSLEVSAAKLIKYFPVFLSLSTLLIDNRKIKKYQDQVEN
jgi:hypothetical protein